jgi:hypothetical protein
MSQRLLVAIRLLMLPVLVLAGFMAYAYSLNFFVSVIPIPKDRSLVFGALLAQGFASAALVSILFCYPLAFIYRKFSIIIALVMILPVLVFYLPGLTRPGRNPIAIIISAYEILAYVVLLVAGAWLAHTHLMRSDIKRNAQVAHPLP